MTRVHTTYPDGETSEATFAASLPEMIALYDDYRGADGNPEAEGCGDPDCYHCDDEWDADTLVDHGGEG